MNFVPYIRVSTARQGESGLGLEAQQFTIDRYIASIPGAVVLECFREVETGKMNDRPELQKAIALCRRAGATLLIAKLDRLARRASFVLSLRDSGIQFVCCDNPQANPLTIGILALLAEHELEMISKRTKEGLAAAKRRGVRLGNPNPAESLAATRAARAANYAAWASRTLPAVQEIRTTGQVASFRGIARCLNARGFRTVLDKPFTHEAVRDLIAYGGFKALPEGNPQS